jgi:hypothetical protein
VRAAGPHRRRGAHARHVAIGGSGCRFRWAQRSRTEPLRCVDASDRRPHRGPENGAASAGIVATERVGVAPSTASSRLWSLSSTSRFYSRLSRRERGSLTVWISEAQTTCQPRPSGPLGADISRSGLRRLDRLLSNRAIGVEDRLNPIHQIEDDFVRRGWSGTILPGWLLRPSQERPP